MGETILNRLLGKRIIDLVLSKNYKVLEVIEANGGDFFSGEKLNKKQVKLLIKNLEKIMNQME